MNYKFIESDEELKSVCDDLLKEKIISVDLEADSMHCYKEKICLIQIATAKEAFLIDPFEIKEIPPFINVLENNDVIKVFHGADFDIRSLDRDYKARVNNLFDTEIACRFLGIKERGLAALLKKNFDVDLDKKFQKVDWARRPLKPEMIEYSVGDVAYLTKLHDIIRKKLVSNGRFSWAKEEFEILARVRYVNNHVLPLFTKFKGAGKLDNRSLAVLENLLHVRLKIAEKKDKPLFKIFSNLSLMIMANKKPVAIDQMIKIGAISKRQADMYGDLCLEAIGKAMDLEHKELPSYPKTRRPKKNIIVQERIERLKKMREKLSSSIGIEPGFLLNNAMIGSIAFENPSTSEDLLKIENIRHWQVDAIGEKIFSSLGFCAF
ncbi:MAG: ribonuclease D [Desulfobacula sp.]|uniref:ribonuclease D n=1 Tax=Desulfobacula sp. TaxID=2593537 RepID=UPI001DB4F975|nr:ribonuclease D [Desulfobacula sp.]MBT3484356.1 ribonuclease D [Desulfobacula sp.]MBT3806714.1 ribonuclease D [Desulfobacula sp.]MBT4024165.1 ribonuclease D [Desulfobacula sp.]MBT4197489.1 ribonuclease D [Desulfobacula sp.]